MSESIIRFWCCVIFILTFVVPRQATASDMKEDYVVCSATPDGPEKQKCMKKLQPKWRSKAFSVKLCGVTFWLEDFIAIDDSLGIHDADYDKAKSMLETVQYANSTRQGDDGYQGLLAEAGYYNSLGPEWKPWQDDCRASAKRSLLNSIR